MKKEFMMKRFLKIITLIIAVGAIIIGTKVTSKAATLDVKQTAATTDTMIFSLDYDLNENEFIKSQKVYIAPYNGDYKELGEINPADRTMTINKLNPGTSYRVKIEYTYLYKSSYGSEYEYTRSETLYEAVTLPGKVTNLRQTKWWYYIEKFDFEFDSQPACEVEVVLYNSKGKKLKTIKGKGNGGSFSGVSNNEVYTAKARTKLNFNGKTYYGAWSDKAYFFTQPMVKATKVKKGKAIIKWNKVKGATSYQVFVSTKEKKGYKKVATVKASKGSVTVKRLNRKKFKAKKNYYTYIVAIKKVGKRKYTSGRHYSYKFKNTSGTVMWTFD